MRRHRLAAGLLLTVLAASGATLTEAADRVARPPRALTEGLRDCPGGVVLPGSATCMTLGGRLTAETTLRTGASATPNSLYRSGVQARVAVDVRTPTDLGPLRVFTAVRARSGALR